MHAYICQMTRPVKHCPAAVQKKNSHYINTEATFHNHLALRLTPPLISIYYSKCMTVNTCRQTACQKLGLGFIDS